MLMPKATVVLTDDRQQVESIRFKDLKRIIKEMEGAEGVTDDTMVLVPTTELLWRSR